MSKLPKGIFSRPNRPGLWVRDRRGGKDRWMKAGETRAEAIRFRDRVYASRVPRERLTIAQAALQWLERDVSLNRNERGQKLARQRVEADLIPFMGARLIGSLSRDDCRRYRLHLEARPPARAPQTIAHILADLRRLLAWAEDSGIVDRSPFPRRLLPRVKEQAPDRLTDEEVAALSALPEPWGFYLRLLLGTGIRWSEARRAEASHVERGHLVLANTKSGRLRRVPLSPELSSEVRTRIGRLVPIVNAQTLAKQGQKVVPRFHVHQTRHTFACRWLEAGGSVTALQEVLGHSSVTTTQRYGRPNEAAVRREAERGWAG